MRKDLLQSLKQDPINLTHLYKLTDPQVGLFQHAKFSAPDLKYGYTMDDNARALILIINLLQKPGLFKDRKKLKRLEKVYFNFFKKAYNPQLNGFRNFLSFQGVWLDKKGSEDSQARSLWALAYVVNFASPSIKKQAGVLFDQVISGLQTFISPRAWAISLRGLYCYPQTRPFNKEIKNLTQKLAFAYQQHRDKDWEWYEDYLTYDNAQLPLAMLLGGSALKKKQFIQIGLRSLAWLLKIQQSKQGYLSLVGNKGWFLKGKQRAQFDQQPLEIPVLIDACLSAYQITHRKEWLKQAKRCFEWFLGSNDLGEAVVNLRTGACGDGLEEGGVNQNQGAESTLAWLWSLMKMKNSD